MSLPAGLRGAVEDRFEFADLAPDAAADLLAEVEHVGVADLVAGVAAPSRSWSSSLIRIGSPSTRKR